MSVQVVDGVRIISDRCAHQARSVGHGGWAVSFLPGRTLTLAQALDAVRFAEFVDSASVFAKSLGLTTREAVHFALDEPAWPVRFFRNDRRSIR
ncbi:hypothetical protein NONO_c58260 [Nocardia nova SH22a]|uniref:Uncharacterized protein n=1 Tax=Nocardia nova SH22a TaxID=1415166 RepID=W5TNQ9_9NOCA|nr:hypothetical protein NONO_c58260 [Nocardia nova SH22a]